MSWYGHTYLPDLWAAKAGRSKPLHPDEELHTIPMDQMLVSPEERAEYEEWLDAQRSELPQTLIDAFTTTPQGDKE